MSDLLIAIGKKGIEAAALFKSFKTWLKVAFYGFLLLSAYSYFHGEEVSPVPGAPASVEKDAKVYSSTKSEESYVAWLMWVVVYFGWEGLKFIFPPVFYFLLMSFHQPLTLKIKKFSGYPITNSQVSKKLCGNILLLVSSTAVFISIMKWEQSVSGALLSGYTLVTVSFPLSEIMFFTAVIRKSQWGTMETLSNVSACLFTPWLLYYLR